MDSDKARFGRRFFSNLRRKRPSESLESSSVSSDKGKAVSAEGTQADYTSAAAQISSDSSTANIWTQDNNELRGLAENLTRCLDKDWIDIEMMQKWLHTCDKDHGSSCCKLFGLDLSSLGRPKWLIDIQNKCLTTAKADNRYACLSYVWGGAATLKTERSNLNTLMQKGSLKSYWDEIPRTIRDTIGLVDQLGIPYLWVDSLCIVQDDIDSKHQQIQTMAGIYANAYVTIIAANGWDANHGLRGIQGVTEPRNLSSLLKTDYEENLPPYSSIWYSRGWTFQEMVFSARKIMFQYQVAIWECNRNFWHESSLSVISTRLQYPNLIKSINPWKLKVKFSEGPDIRQYILMVANYTNRNLTYAEDSLHAISSLLSVMSSSFSGSFISGLPEEFFMEALLWQPKEPMQRRRSSTGVKNLPSWSWAGWQGLMMTDDWFVHWSRLHGHYPRSQELLRQVIPDLKWFYGNTLQERHPVKISCKACRSGVIDPLPSLLRNSSGQKTLESDRQINTASTEPLPIVVGQPSRLISACYLFCRTKRGYFKSARKRDGIYFAEHRSIQDNKGNTIGNVHVNLIQTIAEQSADGNECELVIISAGVGWTAYIQGGASLSVPNTRQSWPAYDVMVWENVRWQNYAERVPMIEFYYVMWIKWQDGIAYRKGLGRVFREAWDCHDTEEIDLVLG